MSILEIKKNKVDVYNDSNEISKSNLNVLEINSEAEDSYLISNEEDYINETLNKLKSKKINSLDNLENEYNKNTIIKDRTINVLEKSNLIINKQTDEISQNEHKLNKLNSNISTMNRNIDIENNQTYSKNNKISMLQITFLFCVLAIIAIILGLNNNISNEILKISLTLLGFIYSFIIIFNIHKNNRRHNLRWNTKNWKKQQNYGFLTKIIRKIPMLKTTLIFSAIFGILIYIWKNNLLSEKISKILLGLVVIIYISLIVKHYYQNFLFLRNLKDNIKTTGIKMKSGITNLGSNVKNMGNNIGNNIGNLGNDTKEEMINFSFSSEQ